MFNVGIYLQILGVLVALASIERTIIARGYEEVRQMYLKAYQVLLSSERNLAKEGINIPELQVIPMFFRHSGIRKFYFGVALNPRLRALTLISYAVNIALEILPMILIGLIILRLDSSVPFWLWAFTGVITSFWIVSILMAIRSYWRLKTHLKATPMKRLITSVFRALTMIVLRPTKNVWRMFLQAIDFFGMLPAIFIPGRILPLTTTEQRKWYLLNVGSFYIISGLALQLYYFGQ